MVDRDGVVLARLRVHFHLEMGISPVQPASPPQNRTVRFDIPGEVR